MRLSRRACRAAPAMLTCLSAAAALLAVAPGFAATTAPAAPPGADAADAAIPAEPQGFPNADPKLVDSKAVAILTSMSQAYHALHSFSVTVEMKQAGATTSDSRTSVTLKQPNLLVADTSAAGNTTRVVADGIHIYVLDSSDKSRYLKLDSPPSSDLVILEASQLGHANFGLLPFLLTNGSPLGPLRQSIGDLSLLPGGTVDGVAVDRLASNLKFGENGAAGTGKLVLSIGKDDHLLRKLEYQQLTPADRASSVVETHSNIMINPPLDRSAFAFVPPAGSSQIGELDPAAYDASLIVGATPAGFSATDLDGAPISLGKLKGKVVLLDFWATFSKPSQDEAANLAAVYKKYHQQGFEIVGIAMDPADNRDKVMAFLKKHEISWPQIFDGKGGKGAVASTYKVEAVPFTLLIGRDGKIAAVDVRGMQLDPAVGAALAEKAE